jgi:hypothetical protein
VLPFMPRAGTSNIFLERGRWSSTKLKNIQLKP